MAPTAGSTNSRKSDAVIVAGTARTARMVPISAACCGGGGRNDCGSCASRSASTLSRNRWTTPKVTSVDPVVNESQDGRAGAESGATSSMLKVLWAWKAASGPRCWSTDERLLVDALSVASANSISMGPKRKSTSGALLSALVYASGEDLTDAK